VFDRLDALADALRFDDLERAAVAELPEADAADVEDLWRYVAWARFETGRLREALRAARRARDPLYEAKAMFHMWDLRGAGKALAACDDAGYDAEDTAEVEWYRGVLAEFRGTDERAHFAYAMQLAPDVFPEPVRLREDEVEAVLRDAIRGLPGPVKAALENTVIELQPLPKMHRDVDPLSLGLYLGKGPLESLDDVAGLLAPPRIEIYQRNIERIARNRLEAIEELRITLLHEVGHHLGYDEDGVERLGLG